MPSIGLPVTLSINDHGYFYVKPREFLLHELGIVIRMRMYISVGSNRSGDFHIINTCLALHAKH